MAGESLFFIRKRPGTLPTARLLFPPVGRLQLTSASRETVYESQRDYRWDGNTVDLPAGSRIPFKDRADLFPPVGAEHCMEHQRGEEKVGLYFGEGHLFHDQQAEASYDYQSPWKGFIPRSQLGSLPCTARKLASPVPLKICVIGDSISAGCNASAVSGVPPFLPPYPELWAGAIRRHRQGEVILKNFAVSGTGMKYGLEVVEAVMREAPDLVVLAYGMNDVGFNPVEDYLACATRIVETVRERRPETEMILIASILGNPDWVYTPRENFPPFRDALQSLCGPGIVLADLTRLWSDLLQIKSYHDLTGNGVNHPNDFGHRIYAQFLLDLLGIDSSSFH
jgi:lysophospholipase L1-like esterase